MVGKELSGEASGVGREGAILKLHEFGRKGSQTQLLIAVDDCKTGQLLGPLIMLVVVVMRGRLMNLSLVVMHWFMVFEFNASEERCYLIMFLEVSHVHSGGSLGAEPPWTMCLPPTPRFSAQSIAPKNFNLSQNLSPISCFSPSYSSRISPNPTLSSRFSPRLT